MEIEYLFSSEKNDQLKELRGITFEEIIYHIENGNLLDIIKHPNQEKYGGQFFYVVNIDDYIYLVPFKREKNLIFLITIFPSRKYTKNYMKKAFKNH